MSNVKPTYTSPTDGLPKPVNTATDSISVNAVYVETSATPDTSVGMSRDGSDNLVLEDLVAGSYTLSQLVGGGGGPDAGQREPALARYDFSGTPGPTLPTMPSAPTFSGTVRYVGSLGGDFATVAAAVAASSPGDIIEIRNGYTSQETGTVTINKSLEIRGVDVANCGISGPFPSTLTGPLLDILAGVNDVYLHDFAVVQLQSPQLDGGGTSSCITARTMSETYPNGSTGLYFKNLQLTHPKIGISIQGNGYVIESCTFTCNVNFRNTTIAAGSNGLSLPQATINVADTTLFPTSGTLLVTTSAGQQTVTYANKTATSFTGCAGGTGVMSTGGAVQLLAGGDVRAIINYGQVGDCFVKDCTFNAAPDLVTPRSTVCLIRALNIGSGNFISGHAGNLVFQNATTAGTVYKEYVIQDSFHQAGLRNNALNTYELPPADGGFGLWFEGCNFSTPYSSNSITFDYNLATTIAAGSNGQTLPQATINVASASSFPATGSFKIRTTAGVETVNYTGRTATTFTGCTGGTGTMATGDSLWNQNPLDFFSDIYVNNCTGAARTSANQKGFIAVASSSATSTSNRLIGVPSVGLWALGTNTFGSVPAGTYANATTLSGFLGLESARYALPSPLLSPTTPVYVPSGALTADGVSLNVGDRAFLYQQDDATYSGLYEVQAGQWTRVADMDTGAAAAGYYWWVLAGTTYANTQYVVSSLPGADVVGTDALAFRRVLVNANDTMNVSLSAPIAVSLTGGVTADLNGGSARLLGTNFAIVNASGAGSSIRIGTDSNACDILIGADGTTNKTTTIGNPIGGSPINLNPATFTLNGDEGAATEVLTSQGPGLPPIWAPAASGGLAHAKLPLGYNQSTTNTILTVAGGAYFDAANYTGYTVKLEAVGFVAGASDTLEVVLYDVTNAVAAATVTLTSLTTSGTRSAALVLASGDNVYEVQIRNSTSTGNVTLVAANITID